MHCLTAEQFLLLSESPNGDFSLKHALLALAAISFLATAIPAKAGCNGTYHCTTTYNGKQACSC